MNRKTEADFVKWIQLQVYYYSPILGLGIQRIGVERVPPDSDKYMEITCTYPYLEPTIRYSQKIYRGWTRGEVKPDRILHELCHILTDPLYIKAISRHVSKEEVIDERERLTDTMSIIIRNLLEDESKTKKRRTTISKTQAKKV